MVVEWRACTSLVPQELTLDAVTRLPYDWSTPKALHKGSSEPSGGTVKYCTNCGGLRGTTTFCVGCGQQTPPDSPSPGPTAAGPRETGADDATRSIAQSPAPPPSQGAWPAEPPPVPTTGPDQRPTPGVRRRGRAALAVATVILLIAAAAGAAWWFMRDDQGPVSSADRTAAAPTSGETVSSSPAVPDESDGTAILSPSSTSSPSATSSPRPDTLTSDAALSLSAAAAQADLLRRTKRDARQLAGLADSWVPQVSSKCTGIAVDMGPGYMPDGTVDVGAVSVQQILAMQIALENRHQALTTTAVDVGIDQKAGTSCPSKTIWMSLVPRSFASAQGALGWCETEGYPQGECAARWLVAPGLSGTKMETRE